MVIKLLYVDTKFQKGFEKAWNYINENITLSQRVDLKENWNYMIIWKIPNELEENDIVIDNITIYELQIQQMIDHFKISDYKIMSPSARGFLKLSKLSRDINLRVTKLEKDLIDELRRYDSYRFLAEKCWESCHRKLKRWEEHIDTAQSVKNSKAFRLMMKLYPFLIPESFMKASIDSLIEELEDSIVEEVKNMGYNLIKPVINSDGVLLRKLHNQKRVFLFHGRYYLIDDQNESIEAFETEKEAFSQIQNGD